MNKYSNVWDYSTRSVEYKVWKQDSTYKLNTKSYTNIRKWVGRLDSQKRSQKCKYKGHKCLK